MPSTSHPPFPTSVINKTPAPVSGPTHANGAATALVFALRGLRWSLYLCAVAALILLLHKSAPPPVVATAEAAARVEQKFQDVQQAVSQGQSATLRMDETELNSYLASHLEFAPSGVTSLAAADSSTKAAAEGQAAGDTVAPTRSNVRDVRVQLLGDRVKAYVVFAVHGKDMTLQLEGRLGADNGLLRFEPVSGQIGALPIPQAMLEAMARKILDSPENREKLALPDDISDLKIENGEVVAEYQSSGEPDER